MTEMTNVKKWLEDKEKALAKGVIKWKLSSDGKAAPDEKTLDSGAEKAVAEANRIIRERGKEVLSGIKSGFKEFIERKGRDNDGKR